MTDPTIAYVSIAIPLGVAFGLSLAIERTIEWFSNIGDLFHGRYKDTQIPSANTADRALEEMLAKKRYDEERMQIEKEMSSKVNLLITRIANEKDDTKKLLLKKELSKLEAEHNYGEKHDGPIFLMQEATNPNEGWLLKHFLTHLFGFSMGILLAHFANLHLFGAMINALDKTMQIPGWLDNVFSGLLIGSGSAPIHFLIGFISVRKITVSQSLDRSETTKVSPSNNVPSLSTVTPVVTQPSASPVITSVSTYSW
jgi:hypothetical protein